MSNNQPNTRQWSGAWSQTVAASLNQQKTENQPLYSSLGLKSMSDNPFMMKMPQQQKQPENAVEDFPALPSASNRSKPRESSLEKHGLLGLLQVIRMTDQDLNMLALGSDLNSLGLNISSTEPLYPLFHSPWSDARHNLDYILPSCYNVQPPPPAIHKIHSFSDETLFYIFYNMPRDALQEAAAQELTLRQWRYHKEFKLWFIKDPSVDLEAKTAVFEKGTFVFFDVSRWEKVKKDHVILLEQVEEK